MPSIHAVDYLKSPHAADFSVRVAFGDQAFFQRLVLKSWRDESSAQDFDFSHTVFAGPAADAAAVFDALSTRSLFASGRQLVLIEDADSFVSKNRPALEKYAASPSRSSVLALAVKTWPSNTRLAKMVAEKGLAVDCGAPPSAKLLAWLKSWAQSEHQCKLPADAADLLLDSVGPEPGLLDQELAKLSLVAQDGKITLESVEQFAGGWRVKTAWSMLDAALAGNALEALLQLGKLIESGEAPIGLLAQMASSLRKFLAAARYVERREMMGKKAALREALEAAGFKSFLLEKAEGQLRHLGRKRATQLGRWLLETDLALKGASSAPAKARLAVEQFVLRLAAPERPHAVTRGRSIP